MQRFTLDQLETLRALIEDGTFEKAARRLHVTASAVSQRVKAMEQASGRVLVQRTSPVLLTAAGAVVLRYARQVELLEADTERALQENGPADRPVLISLAVNADSLATWFLGALAGVAADLDLTFDLHREDQEHTISLLRSGAVMAAVTSNRESIQGCVTEPLGRMRYRAVATPAFVTRWLPTGLDALSAAPVVTFDRNDDLQDAFLRAHAARPRHPATSSPPRTTSPGPCCSGSAGECCPNSSAWPRSPTAHWWSWRRRIRWTCRSTGSAGTSRHRCWMPCRPRCAPGRAGTCGRSKRRSTRPGVRRDSSAWCR